MNPATFQILLEFSGNYLGRALLPKERLKLQNFHNRALFRQNSRQIVSRQNREIRRQVQAALTQLLERPRQEIPETFGESSDKDFTISGNDNAPPLPRDSKEHGRQ
jgi:hypothetical protein